MKLSKVKFILANVKEIAFKLPDGSLVPRHFHVTEVGRVTKDFIDCGGILRSESVVNFQLWEADDYDHRLHPEKLLKIIEICEKALGLEDLEIEVEYQAGTIGKFNLDFNGDYFLLTNKKTDCLAKDNCGVPEGKEKVDLSGLKDESTQSCCGPDTSCC